MILQHANSRPVGSFLEFAKRINILEERLLRGK